MKCYLGTCSKPSSFSLTKNVPKKIDNSQRPRIASKKNLLHRRGKSATTISARSLSNGNNNDISPERQCFISDDKKSIVQVDKTGICVTQITKSTSHGMFLTKNCNAKDDLCSDASDESSGAKFLLYHGIFFSINFFLFLLNVVKFCCIFLV